MPYTKSHKNLSLRKTLCVWVGGWVLFEYEYFEHCLSVPPRGDPWAVNHLAVNHLPPCRTHWLKPTASLCLCT